MEGPPGGRGGGCHREAWPTSSCSPRPTAAAGDGMTFGDGGPSDAEEAGDRGASDMTEGGGGALWVEEAGCAVVTPGW